MDIFEVISNINLSWLRYAKLLICPNKIFSKIIINSNPETKEFQAQVWLNPALIVKPVAQQKLYSNCDGTGTSEVKLTAIHIAISEAIERWAFYSIGNQVGWQATERYGLWKSTCGMAAFPARSAAIARKNALNEARERWLLFNWWKGRIGCQLISNTNQDKLFKLLTDENIGNMVLICRESSLKNGRKFYSYGFAYRNELKSAQKSAEIELIRNQRALKRFLESESQLEKLSNQESRLLFFSSSAGFTLFESKLNSSKKIKNNIEFPELLIDLELLGPWSVYAKVWKCSYFTHLDELYNSDEKIFYF